MEASDLEVLREWIEKHGVDALFRVVNRSINESWRFARLSVKNGWLPDNPFLAIVEYGSEGNTTMISLKDSTLSIIDKNSLVLGGDAQIVVEREHNGRMDFVRVP